MAPTILGSAAFTEQPPRRTKQVGRGWVRIRTWIGPRNDVDAFLTGTIEPLSPESIDVAEGHPTVITATFPDAEVNLDALQQAEDEAIWELLPTPLDKPLATHPAFQQSGQTPTVIEAIEKALRDGTATATDFDAEFGIPNSNNYRNLRVKGVDSWRTWGFTIRKTIRVGRAVDVSAAEINTQKIVSYNEIGVPSSVKWAQPKYRRWDGTTGNEIPINEWMASPPTIRYVGKKYEITKEWLGAVKFYAIMYEGGSAATTEDGIN